MDNEYLIKERPIKAITVFAIPLMLAAFFQQFYTLADTLNEGQETPAWEHKTENALPTLISQRD